MAGDWTPIEDLTPKKPEIRAISKATGRNRHEVLGRVVEFWIWAAGHTTDGKLRGMDLDGLADLLGPDIEFWQAVCAAKWLQEKPYGLLIPRADHWMTKGAKSRLQKNRRQSRWRENVVADEAQGASTKASTTEQNRTEQNSSDTESDSDLKERPSKEPSNPPQAVAQPLLVRDTRFVADLFRRAKYAGDDGAIFWQTAALVEGSKIPEGWAVDAATGTGAFPSLANRAAYFRTILAERCTKGGVDLELLLRSVRLTRRHPRGVPAQSARPASQRLNSHEQPIVAPVSAALNRILGADP